MKSMALLIGSLVAAAAFTFSPLAGAQAVSGKAEVVDLEVEPQDHQVLVSFNLRGAFDEAVARRLESGLPTDFTYRFRLLRDRKRWLDQPLRTSSLQVVAMYNAVTREYLINYKQDGNLIESRVVREPSALRDAMTVFEALPTFSLDGLAEAIGDRRLLIKVRAELGTRTILSLIPTTITTDWVESRKFRPDRGRSGPMLSAAPSD